MVIETEPDKVYQALTERDSLASCWTTNTTAEPEVGAVDKFRFNGGRFVIKLKVVELEPGKRVSWNVLQGVPDWEGTHIIWDLTSAERGTNLLFGQHSYPSTQNSFASASYNWASYIASLKAYLETGKGSPNPG